MQHLHCITQRGEWVRGYGFLAFWKWSAYEIPDVDPDPILR
jgi:hypothetical protein